VGCKLLDRRGRQNPVLNADLNGPSRGCDQRAGEALNPRERCFLRLKHRKGFIPIERIHGSFEGDIDLEGQSEQVIATDFSESMIMNCCCGFIG